jgi:hypothetical protein
MRIFAKHIDGIDFSERNASVAGAWTFYMGRNLGTVRTSADAIVNFKEILKNQPLAIMRCIRLSIIFH